MTETKDYSFNLTKIFSEIARHNNLKIRVSPACRREGGSAAPPGDGE